jgi:hypothetical protein
MEHYNQNLSHLAEPDTPQGCREANSIELEPWVALWFKEHLEEFGHYGYTSDHSPDRDEPEDLQEIALGYAEHIGKQVFEREETTVSLYVHDMKAEHALADALYNHLPEHGEREEYPMTIFRRLEDKTAEAMNPFIGDDIDEEIGDE